MFDTDRPLYTGQGRWGKSKDGNHWLMCTIGNWCGRSMHDVGWECAQHLPYALVYDQQGLDDTTCDWPIWLTLSTLGFANDACHWLMLMTPFRCAPTMADVCRPWMMLSSIFQHMLLEEHRPWLMLPNIWRYKFDQTDAYTPHIICDGTCWYCITLSNAAFQMCTCNVMCM